MNRFLRTLTAAAAMTTLLAYPREARAEGPTAEEKAQADAFFREGRALLTAGKIAEACGKLAESHRLDPAPGTLVNLALCHEKEGKTARAWAEFNEVAERPGDDKARREFATAHARDLEGKLSRLRLVVTEGGVRPTVKLDGREKTPSAWGSALPLDPGARVVEASAPGHNTWSETVTVPPGPATVEIRVPLLVATAAPAALGPKVAEPQEPRKGAGATRPLGFVLLAVGVVGVGVGSYFGVRTLSKKSDADALCPTNKCAGNADVQALDDAAKSSALISTVGIGVGAAALVVGGVLVLTAPKAGVTTAMTKHGGLVGGRF